MRLRIANAVNEEVFNTGIDAVTLTSTPPPTGGSAAAKTFGGTLKLNNG